MTQYNNSQNNVDFNTPTRSVAVSDTALLTDYIIEVSDTTASRTITLPAPSTTGATVNVGKVLVIKDTSGAAGSGGFPIIIAPAAGTIDGAASVSIDVDYGMATVYCNGSSWFTAQFDYSTAGLAWSVEAAGLALAPGKGYISSAGTAQNFPLPTTCAVGEVMELTQNGAGLVTITQAAGQSVRFGNQVTTAGTGGSISSSAAGDAIKLVCVTANTAFQAVTGAIGNWLVV